MDVAYDSGQNVVRPSETLLKLLGITGRTVEFRIRCDSKGSIKNLDGAVRYSEPSLGDQLHTPERTG